MFENIVEQKNIDNKELSKEFTASAYSVEDGVIEAYENKKHSIIGVQFHPERQKEHPKQVMQIFERFVASCQNM